MNRKQENALKAFALDIRIGTLTALGARGFGHIGGSLSIADALAALYGGVMRVRPQQPDWPERDKLVCSKGHAGPAVYAALAQMGYVPSEDLKTLNQPGTRLPSHCDRLKTPGVDMTTGSLGQGASLAVGMALGDWLKGYDSRVFLILGDGEIDEGQVWEACMFASAHALRNLCVLVDNNKKQLDGLVRDVLCTGDLVAKFAAFGFDAERVNGNDPVAVYNAACKTHPDKPRAIVLDTVKGAGIPEVESAPSNHSMTFAPGQVEAWMKALEEQRARLGDEAHEDRL